MNWMVWLGVGLLAVVLLNVVEGRLSGWTRLARYYPEAGDDAVVTRRLESGELGWLWIHRGTLTLAACSRGLKVSSWLRRPFVVPWSQIRVEQQGGLARPMTQLVFGDPEVGRLRISTASWNSLSERFARS